jgi:hypothetical protein
MVQRRMDAAFLFPVAVKIDTKNNIKQPVALIWCYFEETSQRKIKLIANCFEVNNRYGQNSKLRQAILTGLLQFMTQYLQANPGIEGFYINPPEHGWYQEEDFEPYPIVSLDKLWDKLGGPFIPTAGSISDDKNNYNSSKPKTQLYYYLVSLDELDFRLFVPKTLAEKASPRVISLKTIIQEAVFEMAKTEKNVSKFIENFIIKNQFFLGPFFTVPLEEDLVFIKIMLSVMAPLVISSIQKRQTRLAKYSSFFDDHYLVQMPQLLSRPTNSRSLSF